MPETAAVIIKDAYFEILAAGEEQSLSSSEMQTGIRYLNRMMSRWAAIGYNLGYTEVANPGDEVNIPAGAIDAVISNLAVSLSSQFPESGLNQALITKAALGMKAVRNLSVEIIPSNYPDTLPVGSGNTGCQSGRYNPFYGAPEEPIIGEAGNYISTEE